MSRTKKIASIFLIIAMVITTAATAFAAPTHIIVGDRAYSVIDALNDSYRQTLSVAVEGADDIYIVEEGKIVRKSDVAPGAGYKADVKAATNRVNELGKVWRVNKDGKLGEVMDFSYLNPDPEINRQKLEKAVATAEAENQADYTAESWTKLESALKLPETTQKEVDAKVVAINAAIDGLVKAPVDPQIDKAALEAAVAAAKAENQADYTVESWTKLANALKLPETTQAEVDAKVADINAAIDGLVSKPVEPGKEAPEHEVRILNSTIPGQKQVYVLLADGEDGSVWRAFVKRGSDKVELTYNESFNRFQGATFEADAKEENVTFQKKEVQEPVEPVEPGKEAPEHEVRILNSTIPGQKQVYVLLADEEDGSVWRAFVKRGSDKVELTYNESNNRFQGATFEADAKEENVTFEKR